MPRKCLLFFEELCAVGVLGFLLGCVRLLPGGE